MRIFFLNFAKAGRFKRCYRWKFLRCSFSISLLNLSVVFGQGRENYITVPNQAPNLSFHFLCSDLESPLTSVNEDFTLYDMYLYLRGGGGWDFKIILYLGVVTLRSP
jgi:hypothetical protein